MREIETKVDVGVKFIKVCQNIITRRIPRHANSSAADVHLTGNFLRQIPLDANAVCLSELGFELSLTARSPRDVRPASNQRWQAAHQ